MLDTLLEDPDLIPANMTVRFGPGTFQTRGVGAPTTGFRVKAQQSYVGAGMYQTTLQIVKAAVTPPFTDVAAFGSGVSVEDVALSDLTLDCNLLRQSKSSIGLASLVAKAVGFSLASRVRLRRVRIINWGTHTQFDPAVPDASKECFPIFIVSKADGGRGEAVVEDCVLEQPEFSQGRESTMILNRAEWRSPNILATIRNNYLNGDYTTGTPPYPVEIRGISYASPTMTVKPRWPHRLIAGDHVIISGSSVGAYNDRFVVASADETANIFTITKTGMPAPPTNVGITMQRFVPRAMVAASVTNVLNAGVRTQFAKLTTASPHLRVDGDYIRVSGVRVAGSSDSLFNNVYNGSFVVESVTDTEITYKLNSIPTADPIGPSEVWLDRWPSQAVVINPALSNPLDPNTATGFVIEQSGTDNFCAIVKTAMPHFKVPGDYVTIEGMGADPRFNGFFKVLTYTPTPSPNSRILKCDLRIPWDTTNPPVSVTASGYYNAAWLPQPFQGTTAIKGYGPVVRGNRIVDLKFGGPYHDLGPIEPYPRPPFDMMIWDNYYFFVYTGPYSNVGAPHDNREGSTVAERNIIDLQPFPVGIWEHADIIAIAYHTQNTTPYTFKGLIIRKNIVRFADGVSSPPKPLGGFVQYGISIHSAEKLIIAENLITFPEVREPIIFDDSGIYNFFTNRSIGGKLRTKCKARRGNCRKALLAAKD